MLNNRHHKDFEIYLKKSLKYFANIPLKIHNIQNIPSNILWKIIIPTIKTTWKPRLVLASFLRFVRSCSFDFQFLALALIRSISMLFSLLVLGFPIFNSLCRFLCKYDLPIGTCLFSLQPRCSVPCKVLWAPSCFRNSIWALITFDSNMMPSRC